MTLPLVCLPGLMCTPRVWNDTLAAARLSAQVPALGAHDRIEDIAVDVLRDAPPRFVLAGHSMGGYVALEILRLAPERVAGLFLSSSSARGDTDEQRAGREQAITKARSAGMTAFVSGIARFLLHPDSAASRPILDRMTEMAEAVGIDTFAAHQRAIADRGDHRERLASIRCPLIAAVGAADRITPPALSEEIAALAPGAELRTVEGAGHMTLLENPRATAAALGELMRKVPAEAAHA